MSALPGMHYCKEHQGNHSHYDCHNCDVCKLTARIEAANTVIEKCNLALELNVPLLTTRLAAIFAIAAYREGEMSFNDEGAAMQRGIE